MKVTQFGPGSFPLALAGWSTGATSVNSNFNTEDGGLSATNFLQAATVDGVGPLLRPILNLASGSNITITIDRGPGGSTPSNTARIHATSGGGVSYGSNATRVSEISSVGGMTTVAREDHIHDGIGTITASSSNTMQRGTFNLRPGTNVVFALADTDGSGDLDTLTVHSQLSGGGTATDHNENAAAALVNATTAGDAGNRADHFPGSTLSGNWTNEASALTSGPFINYSVFSGTSPNAAVHYLQTFTPSGAFRIEGRLLIGGTATNLSGICLFARDSGTGDSSGNGVAAWLTWNGGSGLSVRVVTLDTGTFTARSTAVIGPTIPSGGTSGWYYIALERDGSNNWRAAASPDRLSWINTNTTAKTVTIAKAGFRWSINLLAAADFFDVVS